MGASVAYRLRAPDYRRVALGAHRRRGLVHRDHFGSAKHADAIAPTVLGDQRLEALGRPGEQHVDIELRGRLHRAGDDRLGRAVAAHRVDRDCHRTAHPITRSLDLDDLAPAVPTAVDADRVREP